MIAAVARTCCIGQAQGARSASLAKLQKRASILGPAFSELTRIGTMSAFGADQRGFLDISISQAWLLQQLFGIGLGSLLSVIEVIS